MVELIDIYTEDGRKAGRMPKKAYYSWNTDNVPWIKCCTCFVIDEIQKKILFEKRGKRFLDPGKLDLCSGHVQADETPTQSMIRELKEELSITENDSRNIQYLGELKLDYTKLKDETSRKDLKCFVSAYALKIRDVSKIQVDNVEAVSIGWLNLEDTLGFVTNNMTRIPYEQEMKKDYIKIFDNLKKYIYPEINKTKREEKDK